MYGGVCQGISIIRDSTINSHRKKIRSNNRKQKRKEEREELRVLWELFSDRVAGVSLGNEGRKRKAVPGGEEKRGENKAEPGSSDRYYEICV